MKVFVSWSGKKSRDVARVFGDWLPLVLHAVDPFVSAKDIRAGTRWQAEIAKELDDTDFGLICATQENQSSEWLNFEAGALAKSVNSSRVVPLAIDLSPADIANPLGQFQAMRLTKDDVSEVLASMNEACASPIDDTNLRKAIEKWWPDLQDELAKIENKNYGSANASPSPARTDRELLEEVLDSVRGLGRTPAAATRPQASDHVNTERAIGGIDAIIMNGDHGIKAWSTYARDDVVILETQPEPSLELHRKAHAIGSLHGVQVRVSAMDSPEKTGDGSS